MVNTKMVSTLLPFEIRNALIEASKLDKEAPPGESKTRTFVIDGITDRAKFKYPHLFKE